MTYRIDIQHACNGNNLMSDDLIMHWANAALHTLQTSAELTIRLVEPDEMVRLNHAYRQQNKPTNVLAFPSNIPKNVRLARPLLGDIVICPQVLFSESQTQNIPLEAHWAHIVIHGVLHLGGYDHIETDDTRIMQQCEISLLAGLGYDNPYQEDTHLDEYR